MGCHEAGQVVPETRIVQFYSSSVVLVKIVSPHLLSIGASSPRLGGP